MNDIATALETVMLVCFGMSWPLSIIKSYRARTAKGTSVLFHIFILIGYISGITAKILSDKINYVLAFYIINAVMVFINILLYIRNKKLDRALPRG